MAYVRLVRVERFVDQYSRTAPLYDLTTAELRARDARQQQPVQRWIAIDGGKVRGAVVARMRPDDRLFLSFVGDRAHTVGVLSGAATEHTRRPVHAFVAESDSTIVGAFDAAGFHVGSVSEGFSLPFDRVVRALSKWPVPTGFEVRTAAEVDLDRLFTLDNTLRQDVPGCDGWRGDRQMFRSEFEETPPYEPTAYLVAIDRVNDEYAGLIRIWRNVTGPRVGLIGVARQYRNTSIAAALLRQAIAAASTWGHESFVAETSPTNRVIHRRLERLGGTSTGRQLQLVRRHR